MAGLIAGDTLLLLAACWKALADDAGLTGQPSPAGFLVWITGHDILVRNVQWETTQHGARWPAASVAAVVVCVM